MKFGETSRMPGCTTISDQYAPLTSTTDTFGNEVSYEYAPAVLGECRLAKITWGQHANPAIAPSFAQVVLGWEEMPACMGIPIGAQQDYRTGQRIVTGASRLVTVTATAFSPGMPGAPVHTRQITLVYDPTTENCNGPHAPLRMLRSIQESAWGTDAPRVDLPAMTFEYGDPTTTLTTPSPQTLPSSPWGLDPMPHNLAWGYRRTDDRPATIEGMLLDVDGDGLQDRLVNDSIDPATRAISSCRAKWYKNRGPDPITGNVTFSGTVSGTIDLPRLKWRGGDSYPPGGAPFANRAFPDREGCSLNGQITSFENSDDAPGQCHNGPLCASGGFCPGGTPCPTAPGGGPQDDRYRTFLAYRWLDVDADGLTDLVAAAHGDIDAYDIEIGSLPAYFPGEPAMPGIPEHGTWPPCPGEPVDRCKDLGRCLDGARDNCGSGLCLMDWTQVNSCVSTAPAKECFAVIAKTNTDPPPMASPPMHRAPYTRCEGLYPWLIYKNRGNGVFDTVPTVKYQPVPLESDTGDSNFSGPMIGAQHHGILDFDGDGVLDGVVRSIVVGDTANVWQVWLGDGAGGFLPKRYLVPTRPRPHNGISAMDSTTFFGARVQKLGGAIRRERGWPRRPLDDESRHRQREHRDLRRRAASGHREARAPRPSGRSTRHRCRSSRPAATRRSRSRIPRRRSSAPPRSSPGRPRARTASSMSMATAGSMSSRRCRPRPSTSTSVGSSARSGCRIQATTAGAGGSRWRTMKATSMTR